MRHGVHALRRSTQTAARLWRLPRVRRGITFAFIAVPVLVLTYLRFADARRKMAEVDDWYANL